MDSAVNDFWYVTWVAWRKGLMSKVMPTTRDAAAVPFDEFRKGADATHPAMAAFLGLFAPQPLEFLVAFDAYSEDQPYFILTNQRLVVRSGDNPTYQVVPLSEVAEFSCGGLWEYTLEFTLKDGIKHEFCKVGTAPADDALEWAIKKAHKAKAWDYLKKQLTKPRAVHESETIELAAGAAEDSTIRERESQGSSVFTRLLRDGLYILAGAGGLQLYRELNVVLDDGSTGGLAAWLVTAVGTAIVLFVATRLPGPFLDYGNRKDETNDRNTKD